MSEDYVKANLPIFVDVQESCWETIRMADVMGTVPVQELIQEMVEQSWRVVETDRIYTRQVGDDVTLLVEIGEAGAVTVSRRVEGQKVQESQRVDEVARQRVRLSETQQECSCTIGTLMGGALIRAVPRVAREMGLTIVDEQPVFQRAQVLQYQVTLQVELKQ